MLGLLFCVRDCFRSRFALQAEMLALRHIGKVGHDALFNYGLVDANAAVQKAIQ